MKKTTFRISKMDCPSEEQMIRIRLDGMSGIHSLEFDIPQRKLDVYHSGDPGRITDRLQSLDLGASLVETVTADNTEQEDTSRQRSILRQVLAINLFFFMLEIVTGFIARSMGLVADSLDMLADSIVYALALVAVGGTATRKNKVAAASGWFQLTLALLGFAEVIRRFVGDEPIPSYQTMILISVLALAGNVVSLFLLRKNMSKESHMQASLIFTSNDVIVNFGVILAGVMVYLTVSKYPDLIIGVIVFGIVVRGALRILRLSRAD